MSRNGSIFLCLALTAAFAGWALAAKQAVANATRSERELKQASQYRSYSLPIGKLAHRADSVEIAFVGSPAPGVVCSRDAGVISLLGDVLSRAPFVPAEPGLWVTAQTLTFYRAGECVLTLSMLGSTLRCATADYSGDFIVGTETIQDIIRLLDLKRFDLHK